MGQAKLRGTKEERDKIGVEKKIKKELDWLEKKQQEWKNLTPKQKQQRQTMAAIMAVVESFLK